MLPGVLRSPCVAAVVAIFVTSCSGPDAPRAAPSKTPSASPSASIRPSEPAPAATEVGSLYSAAGFNACATIDLRPLSAWRLQTKKSFRPSLPLAPSGSISTACLVENTDAPYLGIPSLLVNVTTSPSMRDAAEYHRLTAFGLRPDFDAPDVGQESVASFSHGLDAAGIDFWRYEWIVQVANLVVTVRLGQLKPQLTPPPKATVAAKTLTVLRATLAAVPKS